VKLGLCFDRALAEEMVELGLFKLNSLLVVDPLSVLKLQDILQVNYVAILSLMSYLNTAVRFTQLKLRIKKHWKIARRISTSLAFIHSH
jgi:hypothetical protein